MIRLAVVLAFVGGVTVLSAQKTEPAFEVASIKPSNPETTVRGSTSSSTRFYRPITSLRSLIEFDYDLPPVRGVGPEWIDTERFTIDARMLAPTPTATMRLMVQELLARRFRLLAHVESRDAPVHELRLARDDGRLGPNIVPTASDCIPVDERSVANPVSNGTRPCGSAVMIGIGFIGSSFRGMPLTALADHLTRTMRMVVRDATGVSGRWDFNLRYAAETGLTAPSLGAFARVPEAPALSTALAEELGLKLVAARGLVELLVIDSAERPTPD